MATFHLTIARLGERLFEGEAKSVILPGREGVFTILARHEPMVAELRAGKVRVEGAEGERQEFELATRGLAEISENQATVLL
jgi:F-type H+-transporting ATPase subunit epsilon